MTPILRHLFTPIFAVALLANAGGGAVAAGGEGESSRAIDRDDVGKLAGQYILLDPLWVSIRDEARNRTYQGGILVRLEPEPARKVDACYAVPDIGRCPGHRLLRKPPDAVGASPSGLCRQAGAGCGGTGGRQRRL